MTKKKSEWNYSPGPLLKKLREFSHSVLKNTIPGTGLKVWRGEESSAQFIGICPPGYEASIKIRKRGSPTWHTLDAVFSSSSHTNLKS